MISNNCYKYSLCFRNRHHTEMDKEYNYPLVAGLALSTAIFAMKRTNEKGYHTVSVKDVETLMKTLQSLDFEHQDRLLDIFYPNMNSSWENNFPYVLKKPCEKTVDDLLLDLTTAIQKIDNDTMKKMGLDQCVVIGAIANLKKIHFLFNDILAQVIERGYCKVFVPAGDFDTMNMTPVQDIKIPSLNDMPMSNLFADKDILYMKSESFSYATANFGGTDIVKSLKDLIPELNVTPEGHLKLYDLCDSLIQF